MARDPICGMDISPSTAKFQADHEGEHFCFCSEGCLTKFMSQNPGAVKKMPTESAGHEHEGMHH